MTKRNTPSLQLALLLALGGVLTLAVPPLLACESSRAAASAPTPPSEQIVPGDTAGPTALPDHSAAAARAGDEGATAVVHAGAARVPVGVAPPAAAAYSAGANTRTQALASRLSVRRFVVAHEIADREPVVREDAFVAGQDRVFAFVEARNVDAEAVGIRIYFDGPSGQRVGDIGLEVPGGQRRWRTWGFSRNVTAPGTWHAVVVDEVGTELAREAFEVR